MSIEAGDAGVDLEVTAVAELEVVVPPEAFREHALLNDPAIYEEAERDWKGWWVKQAKHLHWFREPTQDLDDSNPPFYKWFSDGKINASYNCLDRHVEAGNGDRVAFYWRGEEGEERELTYADLHRDVQRFANALKGLGIEKGDVVGIYMPMIPEVVWRCSRARGSARRTMSCSGASPVTRSRSGWSFPRPRR